MAGRTAFRLPVILLLLVLSFGIFLTDVGEAAGLQKLQHSHRQQRFHKHAPSYYQHPRNRFQPAEPSKQEPASVQQGEDESMDGSALHKPVILPTPGRSHRSPIPKADPEYRHEPVILNREDFLKQFSRGYQGSLDPQSGMEEEEALQDDDYVYDPYEDDALMEEEEFSEDFLSTLAQRAFQEAEEEQQHLFHEEDLYGQQNPFQVDIGQLTVVVSQMVEDSAARFEASRRTATEALNARFDELKELLLTINARQEALEQQFEDHIATQNWIQSILGEADNSYDDYDDYDDGDDDDDDDDDASAGRIEFYSKLHAFASAGENSNEAAVEDGSEKEDDDEAKEESADQEWADQELKLKEEETSKEVSLDHIDLLREDIFDLQRRVTELTDAIMERLPEQEAEEGNEGEMADWQIDLDSDFADDIKEGDADEGEGAGFY